MNPNRLEARWQVYLEMHQNHGGLRFANPEAVMLARLDFFAGAVECYQIGVQGVETLVELRAELAAHVESVQRQAKALEEKFKKAGGSIGNWN